jgi:hypothetical protein
MEGSADISVYGEAKGEYTRQLCVLIVPCLESYFLELLEEAKKSASNPTKTLWHFQTLLQSVPDWNQDKVEKETNLIQSECKCDYLEELLTAVFIAHTKVLSAIRLTTRQKKLQITIPKVNHFLHRVLSESARTLWTNAYLFAETNSIDKQKNLRQVSLLLQESVLQGIRGLLPVKSILREYLHDDDEDVVKKEGGKEEEEEEEAAAASAASAAAKEEEEAAAAASAATAAKAKAEEEAKAKAKEEEEAKAKEEAAAAKEEEEAKAKEEEKEAEAKAEEAKEAKETKTASPPTIIIDTKQSVSFSQDHVMFDSNTLENNEIHDIPFAEAELREDEEETESLKITDEILPMDADEIL